MFPFPSKKEAVMSKRDVLIAGIAVAAIAIGLAATRPWSQSPDSWTESENAWPALAKAQGNAPASALRESVRAAVQRSVPAVVNISSTRVEKPNVNGAPFDMPFFDDFFGREFRSPSQRRAHSLGSGVIVSPDGIVVTNDHVIAGAEEIDVILPDGKETKAEVVGSDPKTDIGIIKLAGASNLPVLKLADSSRVEVGEFVLAVGNPFGLRQTVTFGIVSGTGRGGLGIEEIEDFIQTDASINPGNSGGALVNLNGDLIGINTAIVSRGGGNQGIGFAVPSNMARHVMDQIRKHGKVVRGWMGVVIQPVTPELAAALKLKGTEGALVSDVSQGSPAEKAGIQRGDVITEMNGQRVADSRALQLKIAASSPGEEASFTVIRDGSSQTVAVTLGEAPAEKGVAASGGKQGGSRLGVGVQPLTDQLAAELGLRPGTKGVVIVEVEPGSAAEEAGLRQGDVIQEVNRKPVQSVENFRAAVEGLTGDTVLLLINRGGSTVFVTVRKR
jgi:serine protease Do